MTPMNGTHTAPPHMPWHPAYPCTATKHRMDTAQHTSCYMPTSHIPCHAPRTHANHYITPANAEHRQPVHTATWPCAGPEPCVQPACPTTASTHRTCMAVHTSCDMLMSHMPCHAPQERIEPPRHTYECHTDSPPTCPNALRTAIHASPQPAHIAWAWQHTPPGTCPRITSYTMHCTYM